MLRLILLFIAILLIAFISATFADNPGAVTIDIGAYRVDTTLAALALMASILMVSAGGLVWLAGWIRRDMPIVGKNQIFKRQGRGIQLLNRSLVALAAGDHKLAGRLIGQAEALLPPQPMVHLIAAEAATRSGDFEAASTRYRELEKTEEGRLLGLRGLLTEARRKGAENEALRLARQAFKENRKSPWVIKTLFALEIAAANWTEARDALKIATKEGLLSTERSKSHGAALQYAEAMEQSVGGKRAEAKKLLSAAVAAKPDFPAAVCALGRLELGDGNSRKTGRLIMDAWKEAPHPMYATLYKDMDSAESREDWLKRARKLADRNPDHGESRLLMVDAMMDARRYDAVRPVIEDLIKSHPGRRVLQYRLALAHATGEDADAIEASLDTAVDRAGWVCDDCGTRHHSWSVLCPSCKSFDTIHWISADQFALKRPAFDSGNTIALLSDEELLPEIRT
ncbi:hypothetical protein GCM10017044_03770 [Kordiimonas sediminis]|uniref:HemY N-terminal domain-containing protein n=1 Tax=Kordiimonas sediminis TaxID=1735581 RepID=A0A919E4G6_9PROT|nr:heme biosynthesis HemY N-terminal domain-containing protein [Kordiimonas sediminis]GHF13033.1 hypothetical protein GCM10017044_03770 [Kordiimonas sediminis]